MVDKLTIEVLPEELILEIVYFYKLSTSCCRFPWEWTWEWGWHKLAHVCRKWRTVIFASQQRLDLRLLCTPKTSIQQTLDLWPDFPILVEHRWSLGDWENTITALQHRNRVCEIDLSFLNLPEWQHSGTIRRIVASMQGTFPILDRLSFSLSIGTECASSFLGGFAPRLRVLCLDAFVYHEFRLPPILSSATHLVELQLERIHSTNCIPPQALVAALFALVRLRTLYLQFMHVTFNSQISFLHHRHPWSLPLYSD
jgi:hypothetical protein